MSKIENIWHLSPIICGFGMGHSGHLYYVQMIHSQNADMCGQSWRKENIITSSIQPTYEKKELDVKSDIYSSMFLDIDPLLSQFERQ